MNITFTPKTSVYTECFPQYLFIHKTIISKKIVSSVAITIDFTHQPARVRSGQRSAPGCLAAWIMVMQYAQKSEDRATGNPIKSTVYACAHAKVNWKTDGTRSNNSLLLAMIYEYSMVTCGGVTPNGITTGKIKSDRGTQSYETESPNRRTRAGPYHISLWDFICPLSLLHSPNN